MEFGEKLKALRKEKGLTQPALAAQLGVTTRTVQNYESGRMHPKQSDIYRRIAESFGVSTDYLLSGAAAERSAPDLDALIAEVGSLFAGGHLDQDDMDKVVYAINDMYRRARENNEKHAPKGARKGR